MNRNLFLVVILMIQTVVVKAAPAGYVVRPGDQQALEEAVAQWGSYPKLVVQMMVEKYGYPKEITPTQVTWFNNGIWKRSTIYKEEVEHNFPRKHLDVLEQTIDYRVPPAHCADIALFNGSIIIDRTRGEVSSRSDREMSNIIALNIMVEIISGKKTVQQARAAFAAAYESASKGKMPDEYSILLFRTPEVKTADPDVAVRASLTTSNY